MQDPHAPDLAAIHAVDDWGVRLYAIIGATMTLAATLEREIFYLYRDASGLDANSAARIFYRFVKFSHKRDVTDEAVQRALQHSYVLSFWPKLLCELQDLAGPSAARNLISYNPVESDLHIIPDNETGGADIYQSFYIPQNEFQVLIGNRDPQEEGYRTLRAYAQAHFTGIRHVKRFAARVREVLGRPLPGDDSVLAAIRRQHRASGGTKS